MPNSKFSDDQIADKIVSIIEAEGMVERDRITMEATLESLEIQSIEMVMILQGIEDQFEIYVPLDKQVNDLANVGDVVSHITALVREAQQAQA